MSTWRKVGCCLIAAIAAFGAWADVYRVTSTAAGGGNGQAWTDEGTGNAPMTFSEALVAAAAGGEIWLKAETYTFAEQLATFSPTDEVTIRGGFAGTESSAAARSSDARSTLDGADAFNPLVLANTGAVTIERIVFTRAREHGIMKTGAGNVAIRDCDFLGNAVNGSNLNGRGVSIAGTEGTTEVEISNCRFVGNVSTQETWGQYCGNGMGAFLSKLKRATLDSCLFLTNGYALTVSDGMHKYFSHSGGAIYASAAPLTLRRCRFVGNAIPGGASAVYLGGASDGSAFENCAFVLNQNRLARDNASQSGTSVGAVAVSLGAVEQTLDVVNCTFANNIASGNDSPGGLNVVKGTVNVRNCIFRGNRKTAGSIGSDIHVKADGRATIDYTMFCADAKENFSSYVTTASPDLLSGMDTLYFDDPVFVTSDATLDGAIKKSNFSTHILDSAKAEDIANADVHVKSSQGYCTNGGEWLTSPGVDSPAIDMGDPAFSYANEPNVPNGANGGCINLGAYGNTSEAAKTPVGQPAVDEKDIAVTFPDGLTRPHVSVTMGGEGAYVATVTVMTSADGENWNATSVFTKVHTGDVLTDAMNAFYDDGQTVYVKVLTSAKGAEDTVTETTAVAEGVRPNWADHGGDKAKVVHVMFGAVGKGTGNSWADACTNLSLAAELVTETRNEIWVFGGRVTDVPTPTAINPSADVTIYGGFSGDEDAPEDRSGNARTMLDGEGVRTGMVLANANAVSIDRIDFVEMSDHGIAKTGAGNVTIRNCDFLRNAVNTSNLNGRGVSLAGTEGTTEVEISNCRFVGNVSTQETWGQYCGNGMGAFLSKLKRATVEDCLFLTNGYAVTAGDGMHKYMGGAGGAVYASAAPLSLCRCRFVGNAMPSGASAVYLGGASGGSVLEKCAFVLNQSRLARDNASQSGTSVGAVAVSLGAVEQTLGVVNCTFANNIASGNDSPGGLNVVKGTVNVRNCIFRGNRRSAGSIGSDIHVKADGRATIDYTMFCADAKENFSSYVTAASSDLLSGMDTLYFDNPAFVTSDETLDGAIKKSNFSTHILDSAKAEDIANADVHVKSSQGYCTNGGEWLTSPGVDSPAIDKGDELDDYSLEPDYNGERINIGAYGGTTEASKSMRMDTPSLAADPSVEFIGGYTQPEISFTLGDKTGSEYVASVYILVGTGDCADTGAFAVTNLVDGRHVGDHIVYRPSYYFDEGATLTVRVYMPATGAEPYQKDFTYAVEGVKPIWHGHGGDPEKIVHVKQNATGLNNGRSWTDAYTNLYEAISSVKATQSEFWIAGDFACTESSPVYLLTRKFNFYGGFDGHEDAVGERVAGRRSTIDGQTAYATFQLGRANGGNLLLDGINFIRSKSYGFVVTGVDQTGYNARFINCDFRDNQGGLRFISSGCTAVFSNCVISGSDKYSKEAMSLGGMIVTMDDCTVISNGCPLSTAARMSTPGPSSVVVAGRLCARNCRFVANGAVFRVNGGVVVSTGSGSAFTNCLFVGNQSKSSADNYSQWASTGGALHANNADIVNCTFAGNFSDTTNPYAAIGVSAGTVNIENCIFYGNQVGRHRDRDWALDIAVYTNATANIRYSMLESGEFSLCEQPGGKINVGPGVLYGDPRFVSTTNGLNVVTSGNYSCFDANDAALAEKVSTFNVHLRGGSGYWDEVTKEIVRFAKNSRAINAGNPESAYENEPKPNGRCVNMGFYGNTPWATMSDTGLLLFVR